jgi:hypothetical protein
MSKSNSDNKAGNQFFNKWLYVLLENLQPDDVADLNALDQRALALAIPDYVNNQQMLSHLITHPTLQHGDLKELNGVWHYSFYSAQRQEWISSAAVLPTVAVGYALLSSRNIDCPSVTFDEDTVTGISGSFGKRRLLEYKNTNGEQIARTSEDGKAEVNQSNAPILVQ